MAEGLVVRLGHFAAALRDAGLNDDVAANVHDRILDVHGVGLAARGEDAGKATLGLVRSQGGIAESTVWGDQDRLPVAAAALVNGTYCHALDFDDTHLPSVLHPSASVVPAALAAGEAVDASGTELMAAVAVGTEICIRLGMASYDPEIRNSIFFENGLHATSVCGALASAAAAAALLGLDGEGIAHAMGIAASMGAGIIEANRTGGSVKRIHCGWAAHAGVSAAQLALHGLTGPPTVLEGRFGFYRAYSEGRFDTDALVGGLGDRWDLLRVWYKPYPTNHFTHAGIDAALAIVGEGVDTADIEAIELGVPQPVLRTIAQPPEMKARPTSPYTARFSGPFCVAAALVGGGGLGVYLEDFTADTIRDTERIRLAGLVTCYADEEATDIFPHQFPGVLRARLRDGSVVEHRVRHNRGGPENPLSAEELALKFRLNANLSMSPPAVTAIQEAVSSLGVVRARDLAEVLAEPESCSQAGSG